MASNEYFNSTLRGIQNGSPHTYAKNPYNLMKILGASNGIQATKTSSNEAFKKKNASNARSAYERGLQHGALQAFIAQTKKNDALDTLDPALLPDLPRSQ